MEIQHTSEEDKRQQIIAQNKEASKPVLADLSQAGFVIDWIEDLYNKRLNYKKAIPILLQWLPRVDNLAVKEAIVRALSVSWARHTEAPRLLIEEFRRSKKDLGLNWAIGNALSVVADDNVVDDIIDLIQDKSYGTAREMLVVALGNMKSPHVKYKLIELLEDEGLAGYAIMALDRLKYPDTRSAIEPFLNHQKMWVRREAKKALARIDKTKG